MSEREDDDIEYGGLIFQAGCWKKSRFMDDRCICHMVDVTDPKEAACPTHGRDRVYAGQLIHRHAS